MLTRIETPMIWFRLGLWVLKYHLKCRLRSTRGQVEPHKWLNTESECLGGLPWFTMAWFPETPGNWRIWIPAKQHILIPQRKDYGSTALRTSSKHCSMCFFFFFFLSANFNLYPFFEMNHKQTPVSSVLDLKLVSEGRIVLFYLGLCSL